MHVGSEGRPRRATVGQIAKEVNAGSDRKVSDSASQLHLGLLFWQ